ncbi:hypothetical protein OGZ02_04955 [Brachyspira hyodysenteriae]|nr:hypothetical protein [Brachyspira hyodysenteriae]MDA1468205.1 hypothetical protein [Brachyspira hyodysenteriae]
MIIRDLEEGQHYFSSLNKGGENKENIEMVKLLIKNKADVNISYDGDNENEETYL